MEFTLADLVEITGAKRRSIQLWADAGVIVADRQTDRAGTGTHRRFGRDEAIVACVVHAFALHQVAIGELLVISSAVRNWMNSPSLRRLIIDQSVEGTGGWSLLYETCKGRRPVCSAFQGKPDFKYLDQAEGFAAIISLKTYLSRIGRED
jgi:hypothetical protein